MKKRLLLVLVMMLCLFALGIGIAPAEEITVSAPAPEFETADGGMSSKEAFEGYILQAFGQAPARRVLLKATRPLTGASKILYERLAALVKDVAAGKKSSTKIQIPMSTFEITKYSYTAEDLGIDSIFDGGEEPTDDAVQKFYSAVYADIGLDLALVGRKLRLDLPYDMYWASNSYMIFGGFSYTWDSSRTRISVPNDDNFEYTVEVSSAYRKSKDNPGEFNISLANDVQRAAATAKAIVARYANASSDYGKLRGFKNAICDLVDYNYDALKAGTPYGDPWQLVWVFDGNPATKVVCEGYSKAFKYLCDMSSFTEGTSASIVTGSMSGGTGAGRHMWNIVSMHGVNYLVDVTNCDGDPGADTVSVGYPDKLFMAGYSDTSDTANGTWYIYQVGQRAISYLYDADISNLYAAEDLAVTTASHAVDPYILSSADTIELGESITLTVSVPNQDELHFAIPYEHNGSTHEVEVITRSYRQNEMILDFTPESAGSYVFYAGYIDEVTGIQRTDASVRVTVTVPEPDPLTVSGEMKVGTDVTVQVVKQAGWSSLLLEIEYLSEDGTAEFVNSGNVVSDSVSFIGTNFLRVGTYRAVLYRNSETPEGDPEELASAEFQMAHQILVPTQGTLSAEEITLGDELTFTCPGAEALACQLRMTNPATGGNIWGENENPPLSLSVRGDTLNIDYQNTAGILEGYIWARLAGIWRLPQEIRVTVSQPPTSLTDEDVNIYFGAESAVIDKTIGQITLDETAELAGTPQWSVARTAGTAEIAVTGNGKSALVSVTAFPEAEEEAVYTVTCVCGSDIWKKKYTVHYLDLSGLQGPRLQLAADGNFWIVPAGETVTPQNAFMILSGWTPAGGESVKLTAEADAEALAHFSVDAESGTYTALAPGGYDFNLKLSFANVSWSNPWTLYVAREDGTVPAGSYRSQGGNTLTLPGRLTQVGSEAFRGSAAEIVMISEGCTEIGDYAFADMPNLKEITIPSSVSVIGENVFGGSGSFVVYANSDEAVDAALGYAGLLVLTE